VPIPDSAPPGGGTVVVIAIGNEFRRDGEPARLVEAWTGAALAVVVDAVRALPPQPGRVHRFVLDRPGTGPGRSASSHGLGLDDAIGLALALDRMPGRLIVHAIEAADLTQGPGLTPEVAAAVAPVTTAVLADLGPYLQDLSHYASSALPAETETMKALVVYESMYGNTHVISTNIADALRPTHEVTLVPVAAATSDLVAEADLLVVGGPTHMHRLSTDSSRRMAAQAAASQASVLTPDAAGPGLRDWFDGLGDGHGLAASFDTRINARPVFTGRASRGIRKLLKQHGYHLIAAPESFLVTSRSSLLDGEATRARRWGAALGVIATDANVPAGT
jgi:hydrogenase maturation protease